MKNAVQLRKAVVLVFLGVGSVIGSPAIRNFGMSVQEIAFDDYISGHISIYRENMKEDYFNSPNSEFYLNSEWGTANVSTSLTQLRNIREFTTRINSTFNLVNRVGSMQISYELNQVNITGFYKLDGVASSVIIVNGDGQDSILSNGTSWIHTANITINATGYAQLVWNAPQAQSYYQPNSTFEGIVGDDVIGELIRDYLRVVGDNIFFRVRPTAENSLSGLLANYIGNVLQTITIEDILNGNGPITTTTTTMSPSTMRPDLVVDVGADLAGSGWTIPTTSACGYATNLNGFFCDGSPVLIRDPFTGTGFWMSPCTGRCTFSYDNVGSGNNFRRLGFRAYYSDVAVTSRILVDFEHSSGTSHLEFVRGGGEYNEIDFAQYGNLRNINVTMENGGLGHFSVLDRLSVSFN